MKYNFNDLWLEIKPLLGKIRDESDYKELTRFFYNNQQDEEGFSSGELPVANYSKLQKLVTTNVVEIASEGEDGKMLINLDIEGKKPYFSSEQIKEVSIEYAKKLLEDALSRTEIMETIIAITGKTTISEIQEFLEDLIAHLDKYNAIIESIQVRNLYSTSKGYGRLSWRPKKAKRFRLARKYRN